MVLNLGMVRQSEGFGSLVDPTQVICGITLCLASLCANTFYSYINIFLNLKKKAHFIFQTMNASMNAYMGLMWLSTSKKDNNH